MALVLFVGLFAVAFSQTPAPPIVPECDTSELISAYSFVQNKVILYSPAAIGVDAHNQVDLYTSYFTNMHELHLHMLKWLNATHILVGENWSADGGKEHADFMALVRGLEMKLIVTFPVPLRSKDMTSDDFTEVIDESKKAWIRLVDEFTDFLFPTNSSLTGPVLEGFYFKPAPAATMSNDDLKTYYDTIGTFHDLLNQYNASYAKFFVGYPIDQTTGDMYKGPDYLSVPADVWTIDFLSGEKKFAQIVLQDFFSKFRPNLASLQILPFLIADSGSSEDEQCITYQDIYKSLLAQTSGKQQYIWGSALSEMTDEWWRSYSAGAGYSVEGCPNSNAYAHSLCGVHNYGNGIVAMEYIGLWSIRDAPFSYCYIPKKASSWINQTWHQTDPTKCPSWEQVQNESISCAPMNLLVPPRFVYVLAMPPFLCFVVLAVLLIKAPPIPPKRNEEEMSILVESLVA